MAGKLDPILPKLAALLRMLGSGAEAEVVKAVSAMRTLLDRADADFHDIVEALEKPAIGPTAEETAQVYELARKEAYWKFRRQWEEGQRQCGYRPDGAMDWEAIALFCQRRKKHARPKDHDFIDSVAAQSAKPGSRRPIRSRGCSTFLDGSEGESKMTDRNQPLAPQSGARSSVADFLAKKKAEIVAKEGRLIFALDATMSCKDTWDHATQLQASMFREVSAIGASLNLQVVYYRGLGECRASAWENDPPRLLRWMERVECLSGHTQIGRILAHTKRENEAQKVGALIFVGDAMEENAGTLLDAAQDLGKLKLPVFCFQEGDDRESRAVYEEIARGSGGAYARFDSNSAGRLRELLKAAALFATGGLAALTADKSAAATLLLGQMRK